MAFVPVPKDLNRVKTKVMFNLTKRQLICFALAAAAGVPIFFLTKPSLGISTSAMLMVSHVGIYVGDNVMLHCGDPIQYTSINTSYWQSHFYAFGRPNY